MLVPAAVHHSNDLHQTTKPPHLQLHQQLFIQVRQCMPENIVGSGPSSTDCLTDSCPRSCVPQLPTSPASRT